MHTVQQKLLKNQCVDSNPLFFSEKAFLSNLIREGLASLLKVKEKINQFWPLLFIRYYNPNNKKIKRLIRPVRLT